MKQSFNFDLYDSIDILAVQINGRKSVNCHFKSLIKMCEAMFLFLSSLCG